MHALSRIMSTKTPSSPRSPTTFDGEVDDRVGDGGEDDRGRGRKATARPPPGRCRRIACGARCASGSTSRTARTCSCCARSSRRCARRATRSQITARDFAQTLGLLERFGIEHTVVGRHRGGRLAAKGVGLAVALDGARRAGRAAAALRPRARPRLQRRHGRRAAAADPLLDDVRLRVGDGPAHGQLPPRADRRRARGDPAASAWRATARTARSRPTRASRRSTTSPTSSPTRPCSPSSASTRRSRSRSCARRPRSRSITASRTTSSPTCSTACAARQTVVLPRTPEQRAELAGRRLRRARARDRRAVADRLRRPRRVAPAAR